MNKIILIGNLTRDPELTETNTGIAVCKFAIAVQRPYAVKDENRVADFFECTAWRGLGETIARFTKKGKKVAVTGSIQIRNYEDNQGAKRTAVDIIVQDCEFLSPKTDQEEGESIDVSSERKTPQKKPILMPVEDDDGFPF
jgi:single-strand DNA-binding protein